MQLVRTILASCVRFDVVPRLLIGAQRSIELQASGVGPFTPLPPTPNSLALSLSLSLARSALYDCPFLFLATSRPSTLYLSIRFSVFPVPVSPIFLSLSHSLSVSLSLCRSIHISSSRFVAVARAALSEFHFRPITIHPRFKAAVTLRSSLARARAPARRRSPRLTPPPLPALIIAVNPSADYFSMTNARLLPFEGTFIGASNGHVSIRGARLIEERLSDSLSRLFFPPA